MPVQLLDIVRPKAGRGLPAKVEYRWKASRRAAPNLRIRGLSRAGLVLASN
jgi:hypothetical protein